MQIRLDKSFYTDPDTLWIAKSLLGKVLVTSIKEESTAGIIAETEAYLGAADKASHAYGLRRTKRTEVMYSHGGTAYVYLCYGIHHLFNVVTGKENDPQAVLIRELIPIEGIDIMKQRRSLEKRKNLCNGPGKLSQSLGIDLSINGTVLPSDRIWIEDRGILVEDSFIDIGTRIGIDYAEEHALLPYRFTLSRNFRF